MRTYIIIGFVAFMLATSCSQNETTHPQRKDITDAVFASGNIFDENEYLIIAATDEYLNKSFVREGDKVQEGMQLFMLSGEIGSAEYATALANFSDAKIKNSESAPQLQQLKLQISQAYLQLINDESNFKRYENLVKTKAVPQIDYDKAKLQYEASKNNKAILEQSLLDLKRQLALNEKNAFEQLKIQKRNQQNDYITANFNGIVMTVNKNQGEYVRRGETIAKLGDGHPMIKLFIAEEDIKLVKLNDTVVVSINTDKQKTYAARISKIYPAFDTKEQSFIAEARFEKIPEPLFYNTQLQANIIIANKANALIIPAKYVINGNSLQLTNGKILQFEKGISNNEWVEVLNGITEKETIVLQKSKK